LLFELDLQLFAVWCESLETRRQMSQSRSWAQSRDAAN